MLCVFRFGDPNETETFTFHCSFCSPRRFLRINNYMVLWTILLSTRSCLQRIKYYLDKLDRNSPTHFLFRSPFRLHSKRSEVDGSITDHQKNLPRIHFGNQFGLFLRVAVAIGRVNLGQQKSAIGGNNFKKTLITSNQKNSGSSIPSYIFYLHIFIACWLHGRIFLSLCGIFCFALSHGQHIMANGSKIPLIPSIEDWNAKPDHIYQQLFVTYDCQTFPSIALEASSTRPPKRIKRHMFPYVSTDMPSWGAQRAISRSALANQKPHKNWGNNSLPYRIKLTCKYIWFGFMFSGFCLIVIYMRFEDGGLKFLVGWSSRMTVVWGNFRKRKNTWAWCSGEGTGTFL